MRMLRQACEEDGLLGKSLLMRIKMPSDAAAIIRELQKAGFEAYIVGGCVRDSLLKKKPSDWDITTSATPEQVKSLFSVTIDTGIKHGTVTVLKNHVGYEVTTFRVDGTYSDGRHPDKVEFTPSLIEDLKRRDFTINAMAYNDKVGLVDKFGGERDLHKGIIRCVGDPMERFSEDALRMMRAVRFSAQLGFFVDEDTYTAIRKLCANIKKVSAERIAKEFTKLVNSAHPELMQIMYNMELTNYIIPEINPLFAGDANHWHRILAVMSSIEDKDEKRKFDKRAAFLFYDFGGQTASRVLKRLKYDNDTINYVSRLTDLLKRPFESSETEMRRTMNIAGDLMPVLDTIRLNLVLINEGELEVKDIADCQLMYKKIVKRGDAVSISQLKINGDDLMELGIPKGKMIGDTLKYLLDEVIAHPYLNNKQQLSKLALKYKEEVNEKL